MFRILSSQHPAPNSLPVNPDVANLGKASPLPPSRIGSLQVNVNPVGLGEWALHPSPPPGPETNPGPAWRLAVTGPGTVQRSPPQPAPRPGRCSPFPADPAAALRPPLPGPRGSDRFASGGGARGRGTAVPGSSPAPARAPPPRSPRGGGDSGAERGPREAGGERGEPRGPGPAQGRPRLGAERGGRGAGGGRRGGERREVWRRGAGRPGAAGRRGGGGAGAGAMGAGAGGGAGAEAARRAQSPRSCAAGAAQS